MPLENRRELLLHAAVQAERQGYTAFVLPETWAFDTTLLLAEAARHTERIRLASGVLSVWSRSPGTLAMAAATLALLSGGRFTLGLGASTPQLTEGLHDIPFREPVAQMRRVVTQVRALLRGERIPLATATAARPLKLNVPPVTDLPIHLAAIGPASIRLAGEVADGWLPFLYPRDRLSEGVALLRDGAGRAGVARPLPPVSPSIPTVVARDAATAREGAAWFVAFYLTSMGTFYRTSIARQGWAAEVEAVVAANPTARSAIVPPAAEALLEQLTVYGTPDQARRRLERWYAAGAGLPVLLLPPHLAPADVEFMLEALAPV